MIGVSAAHLKTPADTYNPGSDLTTPLYRSARFSPQGTETDDESALPDFAGTASAARTASATPPDYRLTAQLTNIPNWRETAHSAAVPNQIRIVAP